jgi:hypothetical protein
MLFVSFYQTSESTVAVSSDSENPWWFESVAAPVHAPSCTEILHRRELVALNSHRMRLKPVVTRKELFQTLTFNNWGRMQVKDSAFKGPEIRSNTIGMDSGQRLIDNE